MEHRVLFPSERFEIEKPDQWLRAWNRADRLSRQEAIGLLHGARYLCSMNAIETDDLVLTLVTVAENEHDHDVRAVAEQQLARIWMNGRVPLSPDYVQSHLSLLQFLHREREQLLRQPDLNGVRRYLQSFWSTSSGNGMGELSNRRALLNRVIEPLALAMCTWAWTDDLTREGNRTVEVVMRNFLTRHHYNARHVLHRLHWDPSGDHLPSGELFMAIGCEQTAKALIALLARDRRWKEISELVLLGT